MSEIIVKNDADRGYATPSQQMYLRSLITDRGVAYDGSWGALKWLGRRQASRVIDGIKSGEITAIHWEV